MSQGDEVMKTANYPPIPRDLTEGHKRFRWVGKGRSFHDHMAGHVISYRELVGIVGKEFAAELLKREQAKRQPRVIWRARR